jgi:hypothetical protein
VTLGELSNLCFDLMCLLRSLFVRGLEARGEESVKKNRERISQQYSCFLKGPNSALSDSASMGGICVPVWSRAASDDVHRFLEILTTA